MKRKFKDLKTISFVTIIKTELSDKKILEVLERTIDGFNEKNRKTSFISTYGVKRLVYGKKAYPTKEINLLGRTTKKNNSFKVAYSK